MAIKFFMKHMKIKIEYTYLGIIHTEENIQL